MLYKVWAIQLKEEEVGEFKALKPSINQIALKFQQSIRISNEINDLVIKINILKKDQTS